MWFVFKAFKDLWCNERLLNLVEQLIGPDIAGNPAWNLRTKVPRNIVTTVPWHQGLNVTYTLKSICPILSLITIMQETQK